VDVRRVAFVFLVASLSTVLLQGTSNAAGWWNFINLDDPIGIGESLKHRVPDVFFESREEATAARSTAWYAYLIPSFDRTALDRAMLRAEPGNWWEQPSEAILVGDVRLSGQDANLIDAIVHLTVPRISTGRYHFMLCDSECRMPLGDVIPQRVDVAGDPFSAQLARRLERTNLQLEQGGADMRRRLRGARNEIATLETLLTRTREAIATLNNRLERVERDRPSTPWIAYVGWFVAGVALSTLALAAVRPRRRRSSEPSTPADVPDDPRELIESR
jgi:hypothetical protein